MARKSHSRALHVWINGLPVARWRIPPRESMELTYDPAWVASEEARPLSLSLPFAPGGHPLQGARVGYYFDNLLPDSEEIRRRIHERFHTRSRDTFDLLAAVGRDCVGAVQLLPEGQEPEGTFSIQADPLDDAAIERHLLAAASKVPFPGGDDEDFRISIAGAQEKTALTWHEGRWCKPHGSTPTTHIFKLPLGLVGAMGADMRSSVENEWLCAQIVAAYGVPVASCSIQTFGTAKALVVTRFDRRLHPSGRYWLRLPQEDFCQATATPPHSKYEAEGGPGLVAIAKVLQGSESRDTDLATLLRAQLLFWMLAATDGHAKNFSIQLLRQGRYRLTPLYDVLSAWPVVGSKQNQLHPKKLKLAMAVRGKGTHYKLDEIHRRHFNETARQCGYGLDMEPIIDEVLARTPKVLEEVANALPKGFPEDVAHSILAGLKKQAALLEGARGVPSHPER